MRRRLSSLQGRPRHPWAGTGLQGAGGRVRLRASRWLCTNRPMSASTMDILSSVKKVVESRRWHSSRTTGPLPSDSRPESPGEPRVRPLAPRSSGDLGPPLSPPGTSVCRLNEPLGWAGVGGCPAALLTGDGLEGRVKPTRPQRGARGGARARGRRRGAGREKGVRAAGSGSEGREEGGRARGRQREEWGTSGARARARRQRREEGGVRAAGSEEEGVRVAFPQSPCSAGRGWGLSSASPGP